jgi:hypothetical protein
MKSGSIKLLKPSGPNRACYGIYLISILLALHSIYGTLWLLLQCFSRVRKTANSDYKLRHVCLSVCVEQLGSPLDAFSLNLMFMTKYIFFRKSLERFLVSVTLILLTWRIWWAPNNASRWRMGFNLVFKGLKSDKNNAYFTWRPLYFCDNTPPNSS